MVSVRRTFTVSKPIETVVDYLSDFANASSWDPGTKTCTPLQKGPVAVGSTWRNVSVFRGKEQELTYKLVTREPGHLVFEGTNKTVTSTDDMTFTSVAGGTSVNYLANIEFHGLIKLFGWVAKGEFEKLGDKVEEQMPRVLNAL
ncbi:carbon monoxide dehydrogenase subunit G [Nakamurella sp. UYEF19]|uniref:SRPBCC family protein n=1 Tax=Nakamurella sp. UYEF19 TaxID=1756392 RepID=UPI003391EC37